MQHVKRHCFWKMQPVVIGVCVFGVFLVLLWIVLVVLVIPSFECPSILSLGHKTMILGFLGWKRSKLLIYAWWLSAVLSTIGWITGLVLVWSDLQKRTMFAADPWMDEVSCFPQIISETHIIICM